MYDIKNGCEPVVGQLEKWNAAVVDGPLAGLADVLDPEFQIVSDPQIFEHRMDKQGFLDIQKALNISAIEFFEVTARKIEGHISTLILARVSEYDEPFGDRRTISRKRLIYASVWRQSETGDWLCYRHNILCLIGTDE